MIWRDGCRDVHVEGGVLNPFLYHMSTHIHTHTTITYPHKHTHTHIQSHMHTWLVQENRLVLVHQWQPLTPTREDNQLWDMQVQFYKSWMCTFSTSDMMLSLLLHLPKSWVREEEGEEKFLTFKFDRISLHISVRWWAGDIGINDLSSKNML